MTTIPLLSLIIFLPLVGALILLLSPSAQNPQRVFPASLFVSLFTLILSWQLWLGFDHAEAGLQFIDHLPISTIFSYTVGVDGISLFFILLSTILTPMCLLVSAAVINKHQRAYCIAFLVLETAMIGMFAAADMFIFYLFFEAVLIPMFLIIGCWGGERCVYATVKFFLFTLLGSILMLVALIYLRGLADGSQITDLYGLRLPLSNQMWLFLAMFAAFAVKVPMWPVHTWLPDAHVEAPTADSVILAGVLLKMGGYGFIRFSLPILPEASTLFAPIIFLLSAIAVIYTSLVALAQTDLKKLIAYSSVAHMGFVTAGLFSGTLLGAVGGMIQMLSHGVVSAALFLAVGVLYNRLHTREIAKFGGLARPMPRHATFLMIFTLASIALPGTSGFVGEFTVLAGLWPSSVITTIALASGMVLGAAYMLWMVRRVVFGPLGNEQLAKMTDLNLTEILVLIPLAVVVFWMGLLSFSFTQPVELSTAAVIQPYLLAFAQQDWSQWLNDFFSAWSA